MTRSIINTIKRNKGLIVVCIAIFALTTANFDFLVNTTWSDLIGYGATRELYGAYEVIRVVDGDTIVVDIDDIETTVRLIGVDTPESVHPDSKENSEEGTEASEYTKSLLGGTSVYLEYDSFKTDSYGRTLAYVYLEDGRMLQEVLLEEGYATVMTVEPNVKYKNKFQEKEKKQ